MYTLESKHDISQRTTCICTEGTYDGLVCAGKVMLGNTDAKRLAELEREANLLKQLNHPNCHYFIGAKTTEDDGGPLVLTEV